FPDDPGFSKKHYVVSNDEEKTRSLVNQSFRNHVNQIPVNEFIIEILNNKLIIGNRKVIEQQDAIGFAKFTTRYPRDKTTAGNIWLAASLHRVGLADK